MKFWKLTLKERGGDEDVRNIFSIGETEEEAKKFAFILLATTAALDLSKKDLEKSPVMKLANNHISTFFGTKDQGEGEIVACEEIHEKDNELILEFGIPKEDK